jgi:hypothetical protein
MFPPAPAIPSWPRISGITPGNLLNAPEKTECLDQFPSNINYMKEDISVHQNEASSISGQYSPLQEYSRTILHPPSPKNPADKAFLK